MQLVNIRNIAAGIICDVNENHIFSFAAALSYYFLFSIFPLFIFISAVVAYLPVASRVANLCGRLAARIRSWALLRL